MSLNTPGLILTEPIVNILLWHSAGRAIGHDLKERSTFAPAEAVTKRIELMLGISALRRRETAHSSIGELLNSDVRRGEVGCRLGPDRLVEGERIAEIAIRAAAHP